MMLRWASSSTLALEEAVAQEGLAQLGLLRHAAGTAQAWAVRLGSC